MPWEHRIYISGAIPGHQRLSVLLHELRHAWHAEMGRPASEEDECNQVASMMASTMRELIHQGGESAVESLLPGPKADSSETQNTTKKAANRVKVQSRQPAVAGG